MATTFAETPIWSDARLRRRRTRALVIRGLRSRLETAQDRGVALLLLAVALPAIVSIALLQRMRGRKVFDRICLLGRQFQPYDEVRFTIAGPGDWIQRLGVTRLPSLINVLRGELALVGPRPVVAGELCAREPMVRDRHTVEPGLVCLWWVRKRTNIAYGSESESDVEYVNMRTGRGDMGILLRALVASLYGGGGATTADRMRLLGLDLDNTTMHDAVARILAWSRQEGTRRVSFVNPHCANISRQNRDYRSALLTSDLCLPDGIGIKVAGSILGQPVRENVNGTDLFPRLCEALGEAGGSLFLLGGRPGVAEDVRDWIHRHAPDTHIAGVHHGYFDAEGEAVVIDQIAASGAKVLLVAFGVPRQDTWIHRHAASTGVRVAIGVGGLFDFYSGRIRRAPQWLRELGLEWLYRFLQEPRRMFQRYFIGNFTFIARVCWQRRSKR